MLICLTAAARAQTPSSTSPAMVPPPVHVDPASVTPGSKAVARRITMLVADLDRSIRFYEAMGFRNDRRVEVTDVESLKVFGMPPGTRLTFARMTSDNTLSTGRIDGGTIGLAQVHNRKLTRLRDRTRGETMIGTPILVMTTDGVDAVHERLTALGAEILSPPMQLSGGLRSMIARDPDGTRMEITQPQFAPTPPATPAPEPRQP
jgi:catechol 2,3-dioxygenase-like lactoylglutathione lyase family enzyme